MPPVLLMLDVESHKVSPPLMLRVKPRDCLCRLSVCYLQLAQTPSFSYE